MTFRLRLRRLRSQATLCWAAPLALLLSGCTAAPASLDLLTNPDAVVADILVQHGTEFQRYHVVREVLWQECGSVQEESFAPSETHVSMLAEGERQAFLKVLAEIVSKAEADSSAFPEPPKTELNTVRVLVTREKAERTVCMAEDDVRRNEFPGSGSLARLLVLLAKKDVVQCLGGGS